MFSLMSAANLRESSGEMVASAGMAEVEAMGSDSAKASGMRVNVETVHALVGLVGGLYGRTVQNHQAERSKCAISLKHGSACCRVGKRVCTPASGSQVESVAHFGDLQGHSRQSLDKIMFGSLHDSQIFGSVHLETAHSN
jgi:hypothetical protein